MQNFLEQSYCAYEGVYQIPVYGLFAPDYVPCGKLKLQDFAVTKSSTPFHLEYPDATPHYETYVFDVELNEFPNCWRRLTDAIFDEMQKHGARFSWLSLDPGFDFGLMFKDHFAQHVFAFCRSGECPVYVEHEDDLLDHSWKITIKNLEAKWQLVTQSK